MAVVKIINSVTKKGREKYEHKSSSDERIINIIIINSLNDTGRFDFL